MKKILSTMLCLLLLLASVGCAQTPEESYEKQKALYDGIVSQYTELLTAKYNGEELTAPNTDGMSKRDADIAEALYRIVDYKNNSIALKSSGYGYRDLDGNGTLELILLSKYQNIYAIFTISGNKPLLIEAVQSPTYSLMFDDRNRFFMFRSTVTDNIEEGLYCICRVDGDKMAYDNICGKVYNQDEKNVVEIFEMIEDKRIAIDEDRFNTLFYRYMIARTGTNDYMKLFAPRGCFPLTPKGTEGEDLPVADFSSYEAIKETYKKIAACVDDFDSLTWRTGEYDHLFSYPNDTAFEYCNILLYGAYALGRDPASGYDEIDLNGDGQDELVLLDEDYWIRAIFTQKNGVPVMLGVLTGEGVWLDDQGRIHVDREYSNDLKYSIYEFTEQGDFNLIHSVEVVQGSYFSNSYYMTKNGKTEQISYEEAMTLYEEEYRCFEEPFARNEYTRKVSDLTYTPLTQPTENLAESAAAETWHQWRDIGDHKTRSTYVTFENLTDTQMDVNFKHVDTLYVPHPDIDNYYVPGDEIESLLKVTARLENGVFVFDERGVKGRVELYNSCIWIIIEESTDERFSKGIYCYDNFVDESITVIE